MINKSAKLNKDLFSKAIFQEPTRDGYGRGVLEEGKKNKNILVLCADLTE